MVKNKLKFLAVFLVGVLVGGVAIDFYFSKVVIKNAVAFSVSWETRSRIPLETFNATYAYWFMDPATGVYAMEHYVDFMESNKGKEGIFSDSDDVMLRDQGFAYVRIGFLYEKNGMKEEAEQYYSTGLDLYREGLKKDVGKKELLDLVRKVDGFFEKAIKEKGYNSETPRGVIYDYMYETKSSS